MDQKQLEKAKENIINIYENEIQNIKDNEKITNIEFYKDMEIVTQNKNYMGFSTDVYIIQKEIKNENNEIEISYELYDEQGNKIAKVQENGQIEFDEEYIELLKQKLGNLYEKIGIENQTISFEELLEINKDSKVLNMSEKQIQEYKEEMYKNREENKQEEQKDEEQEEKKDEEENEEEIEKVAKKAGMTKNDMKACTQINPKEKITDSKSFSDMIGTNKYEKIYIVASNRSTKGNSKFHFVGVTKDGEVEQLEDFKPTEGVNTGKTITTINRDGSEIEEEQVSALFTINNREGFSVSIEQYGIIQAQYIRRTRENDYIGLDIRSTTQKPTTREVREFMSDTRNPYMQDNVDKAKKQIEESGKTQIKNIDDDINNDEIIDVDEVIKLSNGDETTIRKQAEELEVPLEEYLQEYEKTMGDSAEEKINQVKEEIEQEDRKKEEQEEDNQKTPWGDAMDRMNRNRY